MFAGAVLATSVTIALLPLILGTVHGSRCILAPGMHQLHLAVYAEIQTRGWSELLLTREVL